MATEYVRFAQCSQSLRVNRWICSFRDVTSLLWNWKLDSLLEAGCLVQGLCSSYSFVCCDSYVAAHPYSLSTSRANVSIHHTYTTYVVPLNTYTYTYTLVRLPPTCTHMTHLMDKLAVSTKNSQNKLSQHLLELPSNSPPSMYMCLPSKHADVKSARVDIKHSGISGCQNDYLKGTGGGFGLALSFFEVGHVVSL